jgi:predicted SprT family Zn-dependent metalloprotease
VATYLREEERARDLILDTLGHEMIHYWLWVRRRPYGHTEEFYSKMNEMGVQRYNTVPRLRPYKHWYQCPGCKKEFPTRKKLGALACADCCGKWNQGKFDRRFMLIKIEKETLL